MNKIKQINFQQSRLDQYAYGCTGGVTVTKPGKRNRQAEFKFSSSSLKSLLHLYEFKSSLMDRVD